MISGDKEAINNLLSIKADTIRKVMTAVEKTAIRMSNHAKAGHLHGSNPHAKERYENQTSNLTNSLGPGGGQPMRWEEVSDNRIIGLFGVSDPAPGSPLKYAAYVEERYPFIFPAAVALAEQFVADVAACAPGATETPAEGTT